MTKHAPEIDFEQIDLPDELLDGEADWEKVETYIAKQLRPSWWKRLIPTRGPKSRGRP